MKTQENLPLFRGELALLLAVLVNSFGVVLMLYSGAGISAISSVPYAFSEVWPFFTLGTWTYLFQATLIASLMILRKRFVPMYLFSFVVGFFFSELWISTKHGSASCPTPCLCGLYILSSATCCSASVSLFPTAVDAYHSDRSFSKRTGTDHRNLLSKDQDQLRCDLPAHHSDPDFLILRPDQGAGHRNHHGGIYHGKKHRHDRKYLRQTFPFCYGQRLKKVLTFITLVAIIALNQ